MKLKVNLEILAACNGMKLSQLADKAGLCRQNLSAIKNRGTCSALTAVKIATALGVEVTDIIDEASQSIKRELQHFDEQVSSIFFDVQNQQQKSINQVGIPPKTSEIHDTE